jgi:F420-non-reducing hydrogenase iron-sulfur subunit
MWLLQLVPIPQPTSRASRLNAASMRHRVMAPAGRPRFVLDAFAEGRRLIGYAAATTRGNYKALRRVHVLKRVLADLGIEAQRFRLEWISASEGDKVRTVINEMVGQVRALGPLNVQVPRESFAEEVQ